MVALLAYLALMVVTIGSMLFGAEWLMLPPSHHANPVVHAVVAARKDATAKRVAVPLPPSLNRTDAAIHTDAAIQRDGMPPASVAGTPPPNIAMTATPPAASTAAAGAHQGDVPASIGASVAGVAVVPGAAVPACDVQACEAAYQTFRASDCTYQPSEGERRLCHKSTTTASATSADERPLDARAQQRCNVAACGDAYHTFDPATCTYQPYDGPRRLCTR